MWVSFENRPVARWYQRVIWGLDAEHDVPSTGIKGIVFVTLKKSNYH